MNSSNELSGVFDVVDADDTVVRQVPRLEVHDQGLLHRAVHIFARSGNDEWILQKRSSQKDLDPLLWTSSCSGHLDAGESYLEAAVRECNEELGVMTKTEELYEILRLSPCRETGNEFVRIYLLHKFISPIPNKEEILCLKTFGLENLQRKICDQREEFSTSFLHIFFLLQIQSSCNPSLKILFLPILLL